MQLRPQPFPLPYEMFSRLPTAQPQIPVSLPDAHVLSGRTYSTISHLNVLRLGRELNIQLIALLKKYILDTVNGLDRVLDRERKAPCVSRAQRRNE